MQEGLLPMQKANFNKKENTTLKIMLIWKFEIREIKSVVGIVLNN